MQSSEKQSVAITGADGFIGQSLCSVLEAQGFEVHKILRPRLVQQASKFLHYCELSQPENLKVIFDSIQPSIILHLASQSVPGRNLADFSVQMQNTVSPAISVALTAPEKTRLVLFFGSCEEYGAGAAPFVESQAPNCVSPYGWGKISSQIAVSLIAKQRLLKWCWVRPFLTFGPKQTGARLVPTLIKSCLEQSPTLLTPGEQTRDFIYIEDLTQMVLRILEDASSEIPKSHGEIINLCSGVPRTVRSVSEMVQKIVGTGDLQFGAIPYRENEIMSFYGSTSKFDQLFGRRPHTPIEEALAKTVQWWQETQSLPKSLPLSKVS